MLLNKIKKTKVDKLQLKKIEVIDQDTKLDKICKRLVNHRDYLGIVKSKNPGIIIGVITGVDIAKYLCENKHVDLGKINASYAMNSNYISAKSNETIDEIRNKLITKNLGKIIVFNNNDKPIGMITRESLAFQIKRMANLI